MLSQDKGHIDSLAQAFSEGKFIVILSQIALGEKVHGAKNDPAYLKHKLANTQKCIEMLSNKGIVLEGVTPEDIVNGQKIPIKIFCQALERECKNTSKVTTQQSSSSLRKTSGNLPTSQSHHKTVSIEKDVEQTDKEIVLDDINIATSEQTQQIDSHTADEKTLVETAIVTQVDISIENRQENKHVKKLSLEIPSHKPSNKFLPSPPLKHTKITLQTEEGESKKTDSDAKILRNKSKEDTESHSQKTQLKQRRYSPLDISKLAGRLFDAFSSFSNNDLPELAEEMNEESQTMNTLQTGDTNSKDAPADDVINTAESAVDEDLTVLPPLSLDDLSPEVGDESIKKDAKRILRKSKRQATSIDSLDIVSAREPQDDVTDLNLNLSPLPNTDLLQAQDSISSDRDSTDTLDKTLVTQDSIESNTKSHNKEKNHSKENHRLKSTILTEAHSVEDVWLELQRMKTTVRTHHSIASRFAQDYPVMRRCFESQNQSVRKLERIQHTRGRDVDKELQGKLALMEGYLVQTMRENADLRSKVWGLTTRLTQLEKSGVSSSSSRPSSILSSSEVQRRDQSGIQDISRIKRSMKLKKFFGEEPPPLLEEIPTSFTHDASREDDEVV